MNDQRSTTRPADATAGRWRRFLAAVEHLGADVTVATVWAALVVAIVLFSGIVSQFVYVDF